MNLKKYIKILKAHQKGDPELLAMQDKITEHPYIILLGNGGSNSICSHIAQDLTKKFGKRAFTFSDPSRLTCYINDYGMEKAYEKFLEHMIDFDKKDDYLVILISSSGKSENILNCARYCIGNAIEFGTLTGFSQDNPLREYKLDACFDIWVDSEDYGVIECAHQAFLHTVV